MAHLSATSTALLVMDVQTSIVGRYAPKSEAMLASLQGVIAAARKHGIRVIYVIVAFRPGHPEVSSANKLFGAIKQSGGLISEAVHPAVAPLSHEPVVTKRRVSAFSGSDLEVILRANGIEHLILTGIATSGVVLSTLRQAADADYRLTVIEDCCLDGDAEVHSVLMGKVFPRQADVIVAADFLNLAAV